MKTAGIKRTVWGSFIISGFIGGLYVFSSFLRGYTFGGTRWLQQISVCFLGILMLTILTNALSVIFTFLGLPLPRGADKSNIWQRVIFCVISTFIVVLCIGTAQSFKAQRIFTAVRTGVTLVAAIERYEMTHGSAPDALQKLVPDYIVDLPKDGGYEPAKYNYIKNGDLQKYNGNTWVLFVRLKERTTKPEVILFYPNHQYPEKSRLISSDVGTWALVEFEMGRN